MLRVAWHGREYFHFQPEVVRTGEGMVSQEVVCLGQSWAEIRSLTSGPGSSHSGDMSLGARRGQCGRQAAQIHSPVWDAASQPLGCCICNHGNSIGRKGSGPGLATRPYSQAQLTMLACFLCKERWREHPRVASHRTDLPCQLSCSGRGGRATDAAEGEAREQVESGHPAGKLVPEAMLTAGS